MNKKCDNIIIGKDVSFADMVLSDEKVNKILESLTLKFFPKNGYWNSLCYKRIRDYDITYLPCHLRDNEWLAHTFQIIFNLYNIDYYKILEFVSTSKFFESERYKYELMVVECQIRWIMNDGEDWIVPVGYDEEFVGFHEDYDIIFRLGVLNTLLAIGMDKSVIEEGIEKYSSVWMDYCMERAFQNQYDSSLDHFNYHMDFADVLHRNNWIKLRKYEYYLRNKEVVERYGYNLEKLKMTDEEASRIYVYLIKKNAERLAYIEECKKNPVKKRELNFIVK